MTRPQAYLGRASVAVMVLLFLAESVVSFTSSNRPFKCTFGGIGNGAYKQPLLPLTHLKSTIDSAAGSNSDNEKKSTSDSTVLDFSVTPAATTSGSTSKIPEVEGWRGQLLKASNFASLLCVLDCTVLPIVTLGLPFFGLVAASPAQIEWLHQLGHSIALWFVLPVGGSATLLNYLYAHRKQNIAALGVLGLILVAMANAPHSALQMLHQSILYPVLHAVHHGITHRLVNILGCACLLGSNYLSRKTGKCLHGHDHVECNSHSHSHSQSHVHGEHKDHDH